MRQKVITISRPIQRFFTSYWSFPAVLLLFVLILASFGVSGSSVGVYDGVLNNSTPHFGPVPTRPQGVRSDEWLVNTQMTVAQYNDGFPVINKHIGQGQDMTVVLDVPYKEWSIFLKPQNLMFFIAPLNFAFAFKWWLLAALLAFGVYALFLKLLPKERGAAMLLAGVVFFSPMVQWWYQSITILPIAWGLLALSVLLSIHTEQNRRKRWLLLTLLSYITAAFAMVMYPPFQVPVLLVVMFCYATFLVIQWLQRPNERKEILKTVGLVTVSGLVAGLAVGLYLTQHTAAIHTISQTAYPGKREVAAGGFPLIHVLDNFLAPFYQSPSSVAHYFEIPGGSNQSEISAFIFPIVPLLVLGCFLLFHKKIRSPQRTAILAGSVLALTLFLANLLLPGGDGLYKLTGLSLVPHNRLQLGLGVACITLIIGAAAVMREHKLKPKALVASLVLIVTAAFQVIVLYKVMQRDPGYVSHVFIAICAIVASVGFFGLFLYGRLRLALAVLLIFSVACTVFSNPPQRNINEITDTDFAATIRAIVKQDPQAYWVTNDAVTLENYATANGASSLSGTYAYPQLALWRDLTKDSTTYNRYAHVKFNLDDTTPAPTLTLLAPDTFQVKVSACDPFLRQHNVRYVYGSDPLQSKCLQQIQTLHNTHETIYLYTYRSPS